MKLNKLASLLLAASIALPSMAFADSVAVVNGTPIDKSKVDQIVSQIVGNSNGQAQDTPALREKIKNSLINQQLALDEAKRRGLDKAPAVQEQIKQATDGILQEALAADIVKQSPIDDAAVKSRYDEFAAKLKGSTDMHLQQIVVSSEADAKKVIADLKKGKAFAQLAKEKSIDPNAKQSGGEMGILNTASMPPVLADAVKNLKAGQVTTISAGNIWHVVKLVESRPAVPAPLDQLKPQIVRQLQEEKIEQAMSDLRSKAKIQ
ncbi:MULTISPECIES: peptidyl-prolyl cis-trans isomerase [unclassified Paludibacterium]|uniref:peptidylprolyl isomerase n=1 Tax=unclassified Paludibacterium TaxID=2618429 RepID=UPI001C04325F|nr:peptidyl-prolyl cis-trans isomerase [Paludibacterium sp. B53371]BEV71296.1 peptidylprolyl isomerase [Paludibacterium sp. THUN1379]